MILMLVFTILGALWRRALGGWAVDLYQIGGLTRSILLAGAGGVVFLSSWFSLGLYGALFVMVLFLLHFVMGHKWTVPGLMLLRYSIAPVLLSGFFFYLHNWMGSGVFLLVGPGTAAAYWWVQRPPQSDRLMKFQSSPIKFMSTGTDFIDGNIAVAELASGALAWGALAIALLGNP